jgi:hypothetical protein
LIQARQAQFETDLVRAWSNDPIAQAERHIRDTKKARFLTNGRHNWLFLVSRAGLEPATTALKDQNGLIAGVRSRDFSDD